MPSPSRADALDAIRTLLAYMGEDPKREGLIKTPERVISAWETEWGAGYRDPEFGLTKFDNLEYPTDQMVFVKDISFVSHCEHHLAPFWGMACVAYIPTRKIIGLSKMARVVSHFAARLQVQERMTAQIADYIMEKVSVDCAVSLAAAHMCMISRGVKQPTSKTITTALRGVFREEPNAQEEFLQQVRSR
jgi:GTP cyclohydrolase IA